MGLFSKIKENIQHGGVAIAVVTQPVIPKEATQIAVQVTVTAGSEAQHVNNVNVSLVREEYQNQSTTSSSGSATQREVERPLSSQNTNQSFDLPAGQTATIDVTLPIDSITHADNSALQKATGVMNALAKFGSIGNNGWVHYVVASADVQGIVLDPDARQRVQLEGHESSRFSMRIGL